MAKNFLNVRKFIGGRLFRLRKWLGLWLLRDVVQSLDGLNWRLIHVREPIAIEPPVPIAHKYWYWRGVCDGAARVTSHVYNRIYGIGK